MEKLKNIRDILLTTFVALFCMVFIDSFIYKGKYAYLYMLLATLSLLSIIILSIIIYDQEESKEESLLDSLKNGRSFELSVNYLGKANNETYTKYMRILDGID